MDNPKTDDNEGLRQALAGLVAEDLPNVIADARHEARRRATAALADAMTEALIEGARTQERPASPAVQARHVKATPPVEPAPATRAQPTKPAPRVDGAKPAAPPNPPPTGSDNGLGLYLYCVTRADAGLPTLAGIDPSHAPTTIQNGELAAVVSHVPLADFEEDRLREHLNDMAWLERTARSHEGVLEAVGERETLIPMRLCTIYRGESGVREMLLREHGALKHALAHLEGKSEWGVKVFATETAPAATEPTSGETDDDASAAGTAYMRGRQAERDRREHRHDELHAVCTRIHERLAMVAADAITTAVQRPEVSGHAGEMLLNGVYLVEDDELSRFLAQVDRVSDEYKPLGLEVQPTGPWPAYNFVPGTIGAAW